MTSNSTSLHPSRPWLALGGLTVAACMAAALPLSAADPGELPQRITVPRAYERPLIDGLAGDAVWERGTVSYGFLRQDDGTPARSETRVRALHDRHQLFLAFTAVDPAVAEAFEADQRVFDGWEGRDFVGVRLAAADRDGNRRAVEMRVTPSNRVAVLVDGAEVPAAGIDGLDTAVFRRERGWDVEIALPFAALGFEPPRAGATWQADFLRHRPARGGQPEELSAWNLPGASGEIRFGRDLLVYLWSQRPFSGRDEVIVYNDSDALIQLLAEVTDARTGATVAREPVYLGPGHRRQHFPLPALDAGDYRVVVRRTDSPADGEDVLLVVRRPQFPAQR